MSTFIGQLVGFGVIVWLVVRFVVPPVRKMMADQQNAVRQQLADSAAAADRLAESSRAHEKAKEDAKAEAKRITEEAQSDAKRIVEQLHAQADSEVERIKVQGAKQVELLRAQLIRQLRQDTGSESVRRAGELVRGFVGKPAQQSATVDRFLDHRGTTIALYRNGHSLMVTPNRRPDWVDPGTRGMRRIESGDLIVVGVNRFVSEEPEPDVVTYELDAATNLFSPIVWLFVTNAVADQSGLFQFVDLQASNFPQRFYHIISGQ